MVGGGRKNLMLTASYSSRENYVTKIWKCGKIGLGFCHIFYWIYNDDVSTANHNIQSERE